MTFKSLGLSSPLLKAIQDSGYAEPTPVQKKAIPMILNGSDMVVSARTGTGKTAGFTLPILELLYMRKSSRKNWDRPCCHAASSAKSRLVSFSRTMERAVESADLSER